MRRCLALLIFLVAHPLGAQSASRAADWKAFTNDFDRYAARDSVAGAAVLLLQDGRVIERHEYGFADRVKGKRIDANTIFHYGSITKTLTAISIMQLRDRGRLSLDDRVTSYIPELRLVHDPYGSMDSVTIRMLLSHAAGFQNPTWPYTQGKPWEPFEPTTWNQLVAMMPYQELLFKPGSRYSYSNPGFIYLARIIEQISGDPWETYVQKNILSPLGLSRSYFGVTPYYLANDRSHNYTLGIDSTERERVRDNGTEFDPGITIPNGGWNAPLADIAAYLAFLGNATAGDTARRRIFDTVLSRSSLEEMWKPRYATRPPDAHGEEWVGLSFFIEKRGAATLVGHSGEQAGFVSFMFFDPANGRAIVAAFNTDTELPEARRPGGKGMSAFELIRENALKLVQ